MVEVLENPNLFSGTCKAILDTRVDDAERTAWHSLRLKSLGGSDIAKVLCMSEYGSPLTVYRDKLQLSEPFRGNIHTKFGTRMESHIREWVQEDFKEETGIGLKTYEYPYMLQSLKHHFMTANIDGLGILDKDYVYFENKETGEKRFIPSGKMFGIEIKTASEFLTRMWEGNTIPDEYYFQVEHYMEVTGLDYFIIIYLIGKQVKWKVIPRCDSDIEIMVKRAEDFWNNHIIAEVEPPSIGLECETKAILEGQVLKYDDTVTLSENFITQYNEINNQIKSMEKDKELIKQKIFQQMDNNKKATDGLYKLTRFTVSRDSIDAKKLKEQYPAAYNDVYKGKTEYVNIKISEVK
jgi:putative phage-type endonuclease